MSSRASIIATLGPASAKPETLAAMLAGGLDAVRFNLSWTACPEMCEQVEMVRTAAQAAGKSVVIIADLPGPRVQEGHSHHLDKSAASGFTAHDESLLADCIEAKVEYVAVSYVGSADDIAAARAALRARGGTQKIVAKIERAEALEKLEEIAAAADALMVARGDLGLAIPVEKVPFAQIDIIKAARGAGKPVIVATEMLTSMTEHPEPTRAEVQDVSAAITEGADAVMLSEETATGRYPAQAVAAMERIIVEAEAHRPQELPIRPL